MNDWGTIYNRHLARGDDHGYAAFAADQWERRMKKSTADKKLMDAIEALSDPPNNEVKTGNLYRSKGGRDTKFWYVLAVRKSNGIYGGKAVLIGLGKTGEIISTNTYGCHAMERRDLICNIPLSELTFTDS